MYMIDVDFMLVHILSNSFKYFSFMVPFFKLFNDSRKLGADSAQSVFLYSDLFWITGILILYVNSERLIHFCRFELFGIDILFLLILNIFM